MGHSPREVLTKARKRFISSLSKNLIVVVVAASFGSDLVFKLSGPSRAWLITAGCLGVLTLFIIGVWFAVEGEEEE